MERRRVAVVQPTVRLGGGTEAVTAWTIQALQTDWEVDLITASDVKIEEFDLFYGTQLDPDVCKVIGPAVARVADLTNRFSMLKDHLIMRFCKSVHEEYDLFISVGRGMDMGRRSIQYFSLAPGSTLIKVLSNEGGLGYLYRLGKRSFMRTCELLSGYSQRNMLQNTTLVTSKWAREVVKNVYPLPNCQVVYPPVDISRSDVPWDSREPRFLCIARIVPEKNIAEAIEILKLVRQNGPQVSITIVGRNDNSSYAKKIAQLAKENSWITLTGQMHREELRELMYQCKYGINACADEPFGIVVAEMVAAGCVVFVSNGGGQTEIMNAPELIYDGTEDAVTKISNVLETETLQKTLLCRLRDRGDAFSSQVFCQRMREVVDGFCQPL